MIDLPGMLNNPLFHMGIGMLGASGPTPYPRSVGQIAAEGVQFASQMQRQQQQQLMMQQLVEARKAQETRKAREEDRIRRQRAMAPALAAGLMSTDPMTRQQAVSGILGENPEALPGMLQAQMRTQLPTAGQREFAAFLDMPEDRQRQFLDYRRAMNPFAGLASFMSPVGVDASKWHYPSDPGRKVDPSKTSAQLAGEGAEPKPPKTTAEQAGRTAMIGVASETLGDIRDAIVDPRTGKIDRLLVSTMYGNVPFSQGRVHRQQLEDVLQSKLRLETGSAANPEEIESIIGRFQPSPLDKDEGIVDKLDRLERFFSLTIDKTDPELAAKLRERAKKEKAIIPPPPPGFQEDRP